MNTGDLQGGGSGLESATERVPVFRADREARFLARTLQPRRRTEPDELCRHAEQSRAADGHRGRAPDHVCLLILSFSHSPFHSHQFIRIHRASFSFIRHYLFCIFEDPLSDPNFYI